MADNRKPFDLKLLKKDEYEISFELNGWKVSKVISNYALEKIQAEMDEVTGLTKIAERFDCTGKEARKIDEFWDDYSNRDLCSECSFKWKKCYDCVIKAESPLERDLFLEFCKNKVDVIMQRRIRKDGTFYEFPEEVDFENILTIPDFLPGK